MQWFELGGSLKLDETRRFGRDGEGAGPHSGPDGEDREAGPGRERAGRRARRRPRSSFWKACTRTGASAATKKPGSPPSARRREQPAESEPRRRRQFKQQRRKRLVPMKSVRYSRYTGDDFGLSAEDLMKALSDFFLQSGFRQSLHAVQRVEPAHAGRSEARHRAGARARRDVRSRARRADPPAAGKHDRGAARSVAEPAGAEAGGRRLHQHRASRAGGTGKAESTSRGEGHRQEHRFSGIQDAQGSAGVAGPLQLRRARHARYGHRRRIERRGQALRVRRHDESGHRPDAVFGACGAKA